MKFPSPQLLVRHAKESTLRKRARKQQPERGNQQAVADSILMQVDARCREAAARGDRFVHLMQLSEHDFNPREIAFPKLRRSLVGAARIVFDECKKSDLSTQVIRKLIPDPKAKKEDDPELETYFIRLSW